MMFRKLIIGALLVLPMSFFAAAAAAMDLMDLYREASDHDARYAAARAQFRAAQEAVPQARAGAAREARLKGAVKRHRYRGQLQRPEYR